MKTEKKPPTAATGEVAATGSQREGQGIPSWFGVLGKSARAVKRHEMSAIRKSIARGVVQDRDL
jgi:hypothetical protein